MKNYLSFRKYVIGGIFTLIVVIYIARLFSLQVLNNTYKESAESNAILKKTVYPFRGLIYDRNNKLIVFNKPGYDMLVTLREVHDLDTAEFCKDLGITKEYFLKRIAQIKDRRTNPGYSSFTPQVFMSYLTEAEYGLLQEKMYRYPGFYIQSQFLRQYLMPYGAHALGSIGEVNQKDIEEDPYYSRGDYSGRSGVEKMYEKFLRGQKGYSFFLRDSKGRVKSKYENGEQDIPAVSGKNITISLDMDLQAYGEQLMNNKIGSIVAIEPSSGEILALVSSPGFDPSLLVGRERSKNYNDLMNNKYIPLFDRPLMATYPPGSTFKLVNALIFQQEGIINRNTFYPCHQGYHAGRFKLGCHSHASPLNLVESIQNSCNAYYCYGLRAMLDNPKYDNIHQAFEVWKNHVVSFGFGYTLDVDYPNEKRGFIPNDAFYNKVYGKNGWKSLTVVSISIGQGEILATPIQLANFASIMANRGYYYTPHIIKSIQDTVIDEKYTTKHYTTIDEKYFEPVVEGMYLAVNGSWGSTARIAKLDSIEVCGKTGTAQNPHGKDHSLFICFAPKDNPKIAIAICVENSGFGATFAAPMASLMVEKYLKGYIPDNRKWIEERMLNTNLITSE